MRNEEFDVGRKENKMEYKENGTKGGDGGYKSEDRAGEI